MIRKKKQLKTNIQKQRRLHHWKIRLTFIAIMVGISGGLILLYLKQDFLLQQYDKTINKIIDWTAKSGLVIDEIFIAGRQNTTQEEILSAIKVKSGDPMLNFNISYAKKNLDKLSWIEESSIQRRWPDTLYVHLKERNPMALWQHNKKIHVVDQSGKVLSGVSAKDYNDIPIIIGLNAPDNLSKLLNDLEACPDLLPRITSATWVGNRRWNLSLGKNLTLLLPEQDVQDALKRFKRYEKQHKISVNVLQKIDLRLKNRLIID